jgi:hypothetical protein
MSSIQYEKYEKLSLANSAELDEKWVQERIADDPSILGLGDLLLKDKERIQPRAGRLDLLLQDSEATTRYEVEIQLGSTDEKHIIRTIEYWDIEKKRYPQYEHIAVIVAENITGRFLNVISLFNGFIPLIAIQLNAIRVSGKTSLIFTTVLSQVELGLVEEDEEVSEATDRTYWEQKGTKETVAIADQLLEIVRKFAPELSLKYNKHYIGLAQNDQPNNFVTLKPQKTGIRIEVKIPRSDELDSEMEQNGLDMMDYHNRLRRYLIRLDKNDVKKHEEYLEKLLQESFSLTKE